MRIILLTLFLSAVMDCHCQDMTPSWTFGFSANLDLYKPYSTTGKQYQEKYQNVRSFTCGVQALKTVRASERMTWAIGLAYKKIGFNVRGAYHYYKDYTSTQPDGSYQLKKTDVDERSSSYNLGLSTELDRKLGPADRVTRSSLGINITAYFVELFASKYVLIIDAPKYYASGNGRTSRTVYLIPSASLSAYYRIAFNTDRRFSWSLVGRVGGNVYSNWDQFKRYGWIAIGLECRLNKAKS